MSDRYQFLKEWKEGNKTFLPGSVVRMSAGDANPLIESGYLKQVAAFTLCRINPLAAGGCTVITDDQRMTLTNPVPTFESGQPEEDTKQAGNVLANSTTSKKK